MNRNKPKHIFSQEEELINAHELKIEIGWTGWLKKKSLRCNF